MIFRDKTILITGGTGSLGQNLVRRIMTGALGTPEKIIIFSRDEDKQYHMRLRWQGLAAATDDLIYHDVDKILDFRIGDVKDYESLVSSVRDADIVIHTAALKQVPVCEYFPHESVKTNILGTENIIRAIGDCRNQVETVLAVSTDKACAPVNTYGMCKAIQEKLTVGANVRYPETKFICTRYGNVVGSRGSVVPLFREQIKSGGPLTVTRSDMTRFLVTLDAAVDIVFDTIRSGEAGDIYVPDLTSANIMDLAEVMIGEKNIDVEIIGMRPVEKTHEVLITEEEIPRTFKRGDYYVVRPLLSGTQDTLKPVLSRALSSANRTMSKSELKTFLEEEGVLGHRGK